MAQLRNLGIKLKEAMDSIVPFISPEKDVFYLIGEERGEGKAKELIVRNLLAISILSVEQIANAAEVSIDFVNQVRAKTSDKQ